MATPRCWFVITFVAFMTVTVASARAQTATPTPVPTATPTATCAPMGPCAGARKLNLAWFAKDPFTVRMMVSATQCPPPTHCDLAVNGILVSQPPLIVELKDASGLSMTKTVNDPGFNMNGCPGSDVYSGFSRLKLVYGGAGDTTAVAKLRFSRTQPQPPTLVPPITVKIRDSRCLVETVTFASCYTREKETSWSLKCF